MKEVNIHNADGLMEWNTRALIKGTWYQARPRGLDGIRWRLKCAWLVFTGRADVLTWSGDQ